jgi:hypothetical protein
MIHIKEDDPRPYYFLIFLIAVALSVFLYSMAHGQTRDCVVKCAVLEVGVREATGKNDGERVEEYLASTGLGKGYAWCAAFVNWTMKGCGVKTPGSAAWSPSWFPENRLVYSKAGVGSWRNVRGGDVIGIYFPTKGRIAHVGMFLHDNGSSVTTVEGNTNQAGSREGDGVLKKIRLKSQIDRVASWISD